MTCKSIIHPLVVAAGIGKRFGSEQPKQYTPIHGITVLQHSIAALSRVPELLASDCYVVISKNDAQAKILEFAMPIQWVEGGAERMYSVFNGVKAIIKQHAYDTDTQTMANVWVLIHDAARPCVQVADIERLIAQAKQWPAGGRDGGGRTSPAAARQCRPPHAADGDATRH